MVIDTIILQSAPSISKALKIRIALLPMIIASSKELLRTKKEKTDRIISMILGLTFAS
jgi:hypothetical protein